MYCCLIVVYVGSLGHTQWALYGELALLAGVVELTAECLRLHESHPVRHLRLVLHVAQLHGTCCVRLRYQVFPVEWCGAVGASAVIHYTQIARLSTNGQILVGIVVFLCGQWLSGGLQCHGIASATAYIQCIDGARA